MSVIDNAPDTCDACPAEAHVQAYVYAEHPDWPAPLAYCGSHGTRYLHELHACGATVIDLRHLITP